MDVSNKTLETLLDKTDRAFKRLLEQPESTELNNAYEHAKLELNSFLRAMREDMRKRYKDF